MNCLLMQCPSPDLYEMQLKMREASAVQLSGRLFHANSGQVLLNEIDCMAL